MWYDILVLAILIFFTVRGAARGMVWQLAGIAGIVICFVFADAISAFAGPYVALEKPLNNWVILFGAYVVFTLISYVIAGRITEFLEKVKLKEFDRHLGAVLGFAKGVLLCLIITFLAVTLSEDARASLKLSRSGIAAARIVETLHPYLPILPANLVEALEKYIHLLDDGEAHEHFSHEHEGQPGTGNGQGGQPPVFGVSLGEAGTSKPNPVLPATQGNSGPWLQLGQLVSEQTRQALISAINQEADPATQQTLIQRLVTDLQQAPPEQRQQVDRYFQLLGNQGTQTLLGELKRSLGVSTSNPPTISGTTLTPSQPVAPATSGTETQEQISALKKQIVSAYTSDPQSRLEFEKQIEGYLGKLPVPVYVGVLKDWNADIWSLPDPDPKTTGQSNLEQRILRQLELAGIPVSQLDPAIQQRLKAAGNQTTGSFP